WRARAAADERARDSTRLGGGRGGYRVNLTPHPPSLVGKGEPEPLPRWGRGWGGVALPLAGPLASPASSPRLSGRRASGSGTRSHRRARRSRRSSRGPPPP